MILPIRHSFRLLLVFLAGGLFAGCASVPVDYPRTPSTAFEDQRDTRLGRLFGAEADRHPGLSGFTIVRRGRQAFTDRIAMADLAEHSLDMQYYLWEADTTGRVLAEHILAAADRGVRVRILIDDISLSGRDTAIGAMDAHPNVEIRIFNPFANRRAHVFDFLTDLDRVNHRMHNKGMIADNVVAIVGGRNIGNHYFGVDSDANFRDLDIVATGPVVREFSKVFDHFWNGDWSVPVAALSGHRFDRQDLRDIRLRMRRLVEEQDYPWPLNQDVATLVGELDRVRDELVWAPGRVVWDDPAAIADGFAPGRIYRALLRKLKTLRSELLIESAYFVPQDQGVELIRELVERGVRVQILTNSLASNDVVAAHAGYARYRRQVIEAGAELYELRADAGVIRKKVVSPGSKGGLHTKALVFDRESLFIGSFNLDPRSVSINTEAGLYVESPELAGQVAAYLQEGLGPANSYQVLLDDDGKLVWVTEIDGAEVHFHDEPASTFGQRLLSDFIMMFPIDKQL